MEKNYDVLAADFCKAVFDLAKNESALENLEFYLSRHFGTWIERFAHTPEDIVSELSRFADMEGR